MAFRALTRRQLFPLLSAAALPGQPPVVWVCPMDPGVKATKPERCSKCGMALVPGLPAPEEYPVDMRMTPAAAKAGDEITLRIRIKHPRTGAPAVLEPIHEKLIHLFLVSKDLSVFRHEHPEQQADGSFVYRTRLPKGGMYRALCDFYPQNGTPQLIAKTLFLRGESLASRLLPDTRPQRAENLSVALRTEPATPLAGLKTMLFFKLDPGDGLQQYLGAWGHLLAASADLIDMIHTHPAWEAGGPTVQFNLIFPRPGMHRVWVQFQREGVVNTAAFNLDVQPV
jgi:hypothetical protein